MKFHKILVFIILISLAVYANSSVYSQDDDDDTSDPTEMDEDSWQEQQDEYTAKKTDLTNQLATITTEIEQLKFGLQTRTNAAENAVNAVWAAVGSEAQYEEYKSKFADAEKKAAACKGPEDATEFSKEVMPYISDAGINARMKCLPEFWDRYNSMKKKISDCMGKMVSEKEYYDELNSSLYWPPHKPTAFYTLNSDFLNGISTLGEVDKKIVNSLRKNDFNENVYMNAPNGFCLITQCREIDKDGNDLSHKCASIHNNSSGGLLESIWNGLTNKNIGLYRYILFIVTDRPLNSQSNKKNEFTQFDIENWMTEMNNLEDNFRNKKINDKYFVTIYIYVFEKTENSGKGDFYKDNKLDGKQHLEKIGLLNYF